MFLFRLKNLRIFKFVLDIVGNFCFYEILKIKKKPFSACINLPEQTSIGCSITVIRSNPNFNQEIHLIYQENDELNDFQCNFNKDENVDMTLE